jgi:lantibiotic modifying enzyme
LIGEGESPTDALPHGSEDEVDIAELPIDELCAVLRRPSSGEPTTLPFGELLQPLVDNAASPIAALAHRHSWLCAAVPGLKAHLLGRLTSIAAVPLYLWFRVHSQEGCVADEQAFRLAMTSGNRSPSWSGFFSEYPELARLLAVVVAHWQAASSEFLQRLVADCAALTEFLQASELQIEQVAAGLSDAHDRGRSVIQVGFRDGHRVAYKPRPLEAEAVFARLLEQIAVGDPGRGIPSAAVLSRPTHGWMAWLEPSPPSDSGAWYAAAGRMQCLLQSLGAADAHMANCVATPEGPALIDCECLFTPKAAAEGQEVIRSGQPAASGEVGPAEAAADETDEILSRLQRSLFLPDPRRPAGEPDLSGLFGRGGQPTGYRIPVWSHSSPDGLGVAFVPAALRPQANLIPAAAQPISKMAACAAFLGGFSEMHDYLARHSAEVLGVCAALRERPTRVLLRNTRRYTHILSSSIHPRCLRDREQRRRVIASLLLEDPLAVPSGTADDIVATEMEALERLDIPFFHGADRDLVGEGRILAREFFASSGYDEAGGRLAGLAQEKVDRTLSALRLLWIMTL